MTKNELSIPPIFRHRQQRHQDNYHTSPRPKDTHFIDQVQPLGQEDINSRATEDNSPERQDGLPGIGDKVLIPERDGTEDQLAAGEGDAERDGPVPDEGDPAVDKGHHGRPLFGGQHGAPVVDAAGRRVDGADLGQRGGDGDGDEGDEDPAPEDGHGLAVDEGDVERGAEAEGGGDDGEGAVYGQLKFLGDDKTCYPVKVEVVVDIQTQNTQHAQIARQFALVAHAGQRLVGVGRDGGLLGVGSHSVVGSVHKVRSQFKDER